MDTQDTAGHGEKEVPLSLVADLGRAAAARLWKDHPTAARMHCLGLEKIQVQAVEQERAAAEKPQQLFLPGFKLGAMPNHIQRSSMIAPVARGRRRFHRQTTMVTRSDCVLEYSGEQLDEADGDLLMALIFFARAYPVGDPVPLLRKEVLRKIKTGAIGSTQYDWLHRSMKRLREATLFLEAKKQGGTIRLAIGKMVSFSVLKDLSYDDITETYTYTLDPRWVELFGRREVSFLDWEKRMQIGRGLDMAKALQRLIATSSDPIQRYALDWLKRKMEYGSPLRKFKETLKASVRELVRLGIITKGTIGQSTREKDQLTIFLPPRESENAVA